jgi:hypothetical protein
MGDNWGDAGKIALVCSLVLYLKVSGGWILEGPGPFSKTADPGSFAI